MADFIQSWIYYGDGRVEEVRSLDDVWNVDANDVQVIRQLNPDNPTGPQQLTFGKALYGNYCWRDNHWFLCDDSGYEDYMRNIKGPKRVLFGRSMLKTSDFNKILNRAKADRDADAAQN